MAAYTGYDAEAFAQVVDAPADDENFAVDVNPDGLPVVPRGKRPFSDLANADTIFYEAVSLDDPSKWEVGTGTYTAATGTVDRSDVNVTASSNSNSRVDFKRADGAGASVLVRGRKADEVGGGGD